MTDTMATLEELQESPPEYAEGVARLFSWSANYDHPTPAALFLDIVGYSEEEYGEPMFDMSKITGRFGYMEIGMLAKALDEYSDRPGDVMDYVRAYLEAEMAE